MRDGSQGVSTYQASSAGFALHAPALRDDPLTLVQPLLVIGVVFALPLAPTSRAQASQGRRDRAGRFRHQSPMTDPAASKAL